MENLFIGLMSGTSMDGIDVVLADFDDQPRLLASHSHPIPSSLHTRLVTLSTANSAHEIRLLGETDRLFGECLASAAITLMSKAGVDASRVAAIGSHGQTVRHAPNNKPAWTMQIGDPNTIAELTGITTVADFRRRDVAAGGQGAPLVPAFHQAVFQHPDRDRVVLNIGGMANITILPANEQAPVTGFDTGPGNVLMDEWVRLHEQRDFDRDGRWAATGTCNDTLLQRLLSDVYFQAPPPKSTGRETFNLDWLYGFIHRQPVAPADVQATLTELTAATVADAILRHAPATDEVLVCGGGAHNSLLMDRLRAHLPGHAIETTAAYGIAPDWVEAMAFAWLARQTLLGLPGNLPAVTGARESRILGAIHPGNDGLRH